MKNYFVKLFNFSGPRNLLEQILGQIPFKAIALNEHRQIIYIIKINAKDKASALENIKEIARYITECHVEEAGGNFESEFNDNLGIP